MSADYKTLVVRYQSDISDAVRGMNQVDARSNQSTATINGNMRKMEEKARAFGTVYSLAVSAPLLLAGKKILDTAINAVESENLFSVSMGRMADSARAWADQTSRSLGINKYAMHQYLGTFNVMLTSMGVGTQDALKMSEAMSKLAYDMASFYNLSVDDAFAKLQAGITGEIEPLKRLGIVVNENQVKQYAMTTGMVKQGQQLSETGKIMARFGLIMQATTKAQGDMARTLESPANQLRRLKERATQASVTFGNDLIPTFSKLMSKAEAAVGWFDKLSKSERETVLATSAVAISIGPLVAALSRVPASLMAIGSAARWLVGAGGPFALLAIAITGLIVINKQWADAENSSSEALNNKAKAAERAAMSTKKYADTVAGMSKQDAEIRRSAIQRQIMEKEAKQREMTSQMGFMSTSTSAVDSMPKAMQDEYKKTQKELDNLKKNKAAINDRINSLAPLPAAAGLGTVMSKPTKAPKQKSDVTWKADEREAAMQADADKRKAKVTDRWLKDRIDADTKYAIGLMRLEGLAKQKQNTTQRRRALEETHSADIAAIRADRDKAHQEAIKDANGWKGIASKIEATKKFYDDKVKRILYEEGATNVPVTAYKDREGNTRYSKFTEEEAQRRVDRVGRTLDDRNKRVNDLTKQLNENPSYQAETRSIFSEQVAVFELAAIGYDSAGKKVEASMMRAWAQYKTALRSIEDDEAVLGHKLPVARDVAWAQYGAIVKTARDEQVKAEQDATKQTSEAIAERIAKYREEARQAQETTKEKIRADLEYQQSSVRFTDLVGVWRGAALSGAKQRYAGALETNARYVVPEASRAAPDRREIDKVVAAIINAGQEQSYALNQIAKNTKGLTLTGNGVR